MSKYNKKQLEQMSDEELLKIEKDIRKTKSVTPINDDIFTQYYIPDNHISFPGSEHINRDYSFSQWQPYDMDTRIIGGEDVEPPFKYPFIASLQFEGSHFCGGSIVSDRLILTAAHCVNAIIGEGYATVPYESSEWKVVVGLHDKQNLSTAQIKSVSGYINHPGGQFSNDISFILLSDPIIFDDENLNRVDVISLNDDIDNIQDGSTQTIIGWGISDAYSECPCEFTDRNDTSGKSFQSYDPISIGQPNQSGERTTECDDCEYDFTNYGSECCDTAWYEYGYNCLHLIQNYNWDCSGCECPGDDTSDPCWMGCYLSPPDILQELDISIDNNHTYSWSWVDTDAIITLRNQDEYQLACYGDSGGPSFINQDGYYIQTGIASFITHACHEWTPDDVTVYANVAYEYPFIQDIMTQNHIPGCMQQYSCNYNPDANIIDGTCDSGPEYCHDCDGNCICEIDECGICGGGGWSCGIGSYIPWRNNCSTFTHPVTNELISGQNNYTYNDFCVFNWCPVNGYYIITAADIKVEGFSIIKRYDELEVMNGNPPMCGTEEATCTGFPGCTDNILHRYVTSYCDIENHYGFPIYEPPETFCRFNRDAFPDDNEGWTGYPGDQMDKGTCDILALLYNGVIVGIQYLNFIAKTEPGSGSFEVPGTTMGIMSRDLFTGNMICPKCDQTEFGGWNWCEDVDLDLFPDGYQGEKPNGILLYRANRGTYHTLTEESYNDFFFYGWGGFTPESGIQLDGDAAMPPSAMLNVAIWNGYGNSRVLHFGPPLCPSGEVAGCDDVCTPIGQEVVVDVCGICGGTETNEFNCYTSNVFEQHFYCVPEGECMLFPESGDLGPEWDDHLDIQQIEDNCDTCQGCPGNWECCFGLGAPNEVQGENLIDCSGICGGDSVLDECGICNGSGIPEGECDCEGNIDYGCGCNSLVLGCDGVCGSALVEDCEGVCGGEEYYYDCNGVRCGNYGMDCSTIDNYYYCMGYWYDFGCSWNPQTQACECQSSDPTAGCHCENLLRRKIGPLPYKEGGKVAPEQNQLTENNFMDYWCDRWPDDKRCK